MATNTKPADGALTLVEMKEFAGFSPATQRYIRRALDIGLGRRDAMRRWSRDAGEAASIRAQERIYRRLDQVRANVPDDSGLDEMEPMMGLLVTMTAFDLGQDRLPDFASYRFLYERLIGAAVRPWLPGAFCAAAALPHLHPEKRRALLQSISEAAATAPGWSNREPAFFPEWVDKVDLTVAG
ncbi:MAG: hypothetical protein JO013_10225 [Alphaproteobacteria bacterium]|nr:hypothetical protein [Alphaproteobacteria bacterium]